MSGPDPSGLSSALPDTKFAFWTPSYEDDGLTAGELRHVRELLMAMNLVRKTAAHVGQFTTSDYAKEDHGRQRDAAPQGYPTTRAEKRNEIRKNALESYRRACKGLQAELRSLEDLFKLIGDSEVIIDASEALRSALSSNIERMERIVNLVNHHGHREGNIHWPLDYLFLKTVQFHKSLYHKKHTFRFREVKKWEERMKATHGNVTALWMSLGQAQTAVGQTLDSTPITLVTEELKLFSERVLPTFVAGEEEKATTRYINMTTIATFFSSVTATTLQFSYQRTNSGLGGAVNLLWFVSLVFSVGSGVNSMLGMTWRKSAIFDKSRPPWAIQLWLDNAPMIFLIIAAFSFVIGLNVFSFLSFQPRYVSILTIFFTGFHLLGISVVVAWFLLELRGKGRVLRLIIELGSQIRAFSLQLGILIAKLSHRLQSHTRKAEDSKLPQRAMNLLRNIYWAFGSDDNVGRLSMTYFLVYKSPDSPYGTAKLIRRIVRSTRKLPVKLRSAIVSLHRTALKRSKKRFTDGQEDLEASESPKSVSLPKGEKKIPQPKDLYRQSLEKVFRYKALVDGIMWDIGRWELAGNEYIDDATLKKRLGHMLWGYPDLLNEFYEVVHPLLAPLRAVNAEKARLPDTLQGYELQRDTDDIQIIQASTEELDVVGTGSDAWPMKVRLIEYHPLGQELGNEQEGGSGIPHSPLPSVLAEGELHDDSVPEAFAEGYQIFYPAIPPTFYNPGDDGPLFSFRPPSPDAIFDEERILRWIDVSYVQEADLAYEHGEEIDSFGREMRLSLPMDARRLSFHSGDGGGHEQSFARPGSPASLEVRRDENLESGYSDIRDGDSEEYYGDPRRPYGSEDRQILVAANYDENAKIQSSDFLVAPMPRHTTPEETHVASGAEDTSRVELHRIFLENSEYGEEVNFT